MKLTTATRVAIALVLCAAVASCGGASRDGGDASAPTTAAAALGGAQFTGPGSPGTIYVVVKPGTSPVADLYRVRGALPSARRLTKGANVSLVTARGGAVVVSYAPGSGGDRVAALNLRGTSVLPGRPVDDFGQTPALSGDGRVAYGQPQYTDAGDDAGARVYVARVDGGGQRVAYSARYQLSLGWTSRDELAIARYEGNRIVVNPRGPHRRTIDPGLDKIYTFQSNARGDMWAVGADTVAVIRKGGKARRFKTAWVPVSWSPDGRSILVVTDHRLGLMAPGDGAVREIGQVRNGRIAYATYAR
ncbi:MAG: hypothetical protein QOG15_1499 [Solirubrobacteraceae bacterium]|nr:hypothetical protein [Solirubrobacteraceae bacterium]